MDKQETIQEMNTLRYVEYMTLIAGTEAEVREAIAEILKLRSLALHRATSDLTADDIKHWRKRAYELDELLLTNLSKLDDHRPQHPHLLRYGTLALQWVRGETACYVPIALFNPEEFAYEPTPRKEKLANEISRSKEVLAEIEALEHAEKDPVEASEQEALEAMVYTILQGIAPEPDKPTT